MWCYEVNEHHPPHIRNNTRASKEANPDWISQIEKEALRARQKKQITYEAKEVRLTLSLSFTDIKKPKTMEFFTKQNWRSRYAIHSTIFLYLKTPALYTC